MSEFTVKLKKLINKSYLLIYLLTATSKRKHFFFVIDKL